MNVKRTLVSSALAGLGLCGVATYASSAEQAHSVSAGAILSCAAEVGASAAERRAEVCRNVSPATHPPCNSANSCASIDNEIARSCALFDGQGAPMEGCAPSPKSAEAAAAVVKRYYSALNARDYDTAWAQWGDDGPPHQTAAQFKAGFARTRSTQVTVGALKPGEAAAGSVYQTVPVTVQARLDDGTPQRWRGTYTLRRVNGVEGATAGQLRWHIDSAKLKPVPAN
ncbi:hypothetical protein [Pseudomonas sp. RIT-PI-S]|uniref:hypothetical protein n=1 Tax=Pseudomonas sp. RIT-PI-S TaxID=3035295 RepID=UPI0021DB058F|nr:hypothetical protein [Pseudomonas sp. RIT-PI-S]